MKKQSQRMVVALAVTLCSLFLGNVSFAATKGTEEVTQYLPKSDTVKASVMQMMMPKEAGVIAQKMEKSVQANKEWFMEYAKSATPGEPLPYDPKLGVSKDEYQAFLDSSKNVKFAEEKKIDVTFTKMGNGKFKITTNPTSAINNIIVDEKEGVTTPSFGKLSDFTAINNQDKNSPTGPWKGMQWKTEEVDEAKQDVKSIKFAIGAMENQPNNIIYYDVLNVKAGKKEDQSTLILFYPRT